MVDADEQFYLLVGDRWLHGAMPYVDIWDRKPPGLFALFAAIRLLGGDGVIEYQVVAALFAAATAVVIAIITRRIAGEHAAIVSALSYPLVIGWSGGMGGQSPVFYNLPVALAALIVLRLATDSPWRPTSHAPSFSAPPPFGLSAVEGHAQRALQTQLRSERALTTPSTNGGGKGLASHGAAAMLLIGVGMQIKTSAVFEGMYLGIVLLVLAWRASNLRHPSPVPGSTAPQPRPSAPHAGSPAEPWTPAQGRGDDSRVTGRPLHLAALALLWVAAALLPTAIAWAGFALAGHGEAFVFANVTSILLRHNDPAARQALALGKMVARLSPEIVALAVGSMLAARGIAPWRARPAGTAAYRFVLGWLATAAFGILLFGNYFNHYALPLMVPMAIAIAPAFALERRRIALALAALVLGVNGIAYLVTWQHIVARSGDRAYATQITAVIRQNLRGGRLYVYNGEPILYHLTGSALPTRWPFPYHLSFARETAALGVDPAAEVRRIMASRPAVVVDTWDPSDPDLNRTTQAIVRGALARDYRLVAAFRLRGDLRQVWARLPGQ